MENLINPLQDRIEDWKKTANQLDKDHAKGKTEEARDFSPRGDKYRLGSIPQPRGEQGTLPLLSCPCGDGREIMALWKSIQVAVGGGPQWGSAHGVGVAAHTLQRDLLCFLFSQNTNEPAMRSRRSPPTRSNCKKKPAKVR